MPRIFISYSRVDRPLIVEVAARLRRIYGFDSVWFDEGLHGGDIWWQEILSQIARCDIFIYMLSRDSIESETCLAEWSEARRLRKLVLPVLVRARTPIPPDLSVIQYVDMSSGITVDNITDLEAAINTLSTSVPPMPPKPLAAKPAPIPSDIKPSRPARTLSQTLVMFVKFAVLPFIIVTILFAVPNRTPSPSAQRSTEWSPRIEAINGVEMALVPEGCFMIGSDELAHQQCFNRPFWIDRYEVTNEQYEQRGGVADRPDRWPNSEQPVAWVTWFEARDFCALRGARLPTEVEWEYAARGPNSLAYPWGNEFVGANVVFIENARDRPANVGSRPGGVSWVGAYDMSGNVWEWVSTLFAEYPYVADDGREAMREGLRIHRGGSWNFEPAGLRAVTRVGQDPNFRGDDVGFRCARDA